MLANSMVEILPLWTISSYRYNVNWLAKVLKIPKITAGSGELVLADSSPPLSQRDVGRAVKASATTIGRTLGGSMW